MTTHFLERQDGFDSYVLRSESVEVCIVPELGAKITGLQCLSTGREWMWSPPAGRLFKNNLGDSFPHSTIVGADECFPTIAPCKWKGRNLPDHGEAWTESWDVTLENESIVTSLRCPISPFQIRREASLLGNEFKLHYTLKNVGREAESYLWALHPLIGIQAGDRIDLPTSNILTDLAINCPLGDRRQCGEWPSPQCGIALDQMDFGPYSPAAAKVYTTDLREGRVAIRNQITGGALEFLFDLGELNTVGLWINRGGWNDFEHVALEPTNSNADSLNIAANGNVCGQLQAGQLRHWTIVLKVTAPSTP